MRRSKARTHAPPWLFAAVAFACGDDATGGSSSLTVDQTPASAAEWTSTAPLAIDGEAIAVGTDRDGALYAVIDDRLYVDELSALSERQRLADPGAPSALGAVHRIRSRPGEGVWVATQTGLWTSAGLFLRHRPTDLSPAEVLDVDEIEEGTFAGLWLASPSGVYWIDGQTAQRLESDAPPQRIATSLDAVALLSDRALKVLTQSSGSLFIETPPEAFETYDVAAFDGALFAATDRGLLRYRRGSWTLFELDATKARRTTSLATTSGALWARTDDGLIRFDGTDISLYPAVGDGPFVVDRLGDAYVISEGGLVRASTGEADGPVTTFANDVLPWLQTHCIACHANQTQDFTDYDVFRAVAADALTRVRSGDMPRCDGGVRCPPERYLSEDNYAVLERWIRSGQPQ